MKMFNKIAIIGVGLIGGSIGLGIKKSGVAQEVVGVFRRRSTLKKALKVRAVDKAVMNIKEGVKDADLVILATPVFSIPPMAKEVVKYAKKGVIITDAGSTKKWIVEKIDKLPQVSRGRVFFVGSHPMAGSEHAGVEFAISDLLQGSPCIVTQTGRTNKAALKKIISFWKTLGANVKVMSPADHDKSTSLISHLPHILAFSLAGAVPEKELAYAAEGFKDTTRVASSDPALWADILMSNAKEILNSTVLFEKYYKKIKKALGKGRYPEVVKLLKGAKAKRDKLIYGAG